MQVLNERDKVPPGGWTYEYADKQFRGTTLDHLVYDVRQAYFSNNETPPKDLELLIQDRICKSIPDPEWKCRDLKPPTKAELLIRFGRALIGFARTGFKTVSAEQLGERRDICLACPLWKGESVLGIGKCGACGCTGFKLYAASEKCPQGKWEAIA
jgi:hypothetical protein